MKQHVQPIERLQGNSHVAADKSISHRAFMLSALADGTSTVHHPLLADDAQRTMHAFSQMGIAIEREAPDRFVVHGKGLHGLTAPSTTIDVGNSGTTIRLLIGILAGQRFNSIVTGDASIQRRPMSRVLEPLARMGAHIEGVNGSTLAPLHVHGQPLHGITYTLPVASAQVKSAILLAGLYADGETTVVEKLKTRDHTERMLAAFGVPITTAGERITVTQAHSLQPTEIRVPGDISSAAFPMAAALLIRGSDVVFHHVGVNPTRTGFIEALERMGARIEVVAEREWGGEPVADLRIQHQQLHGAVIDGALIPRLIDEIPILAVLATQAEGVTEIRNAEELRVKESDRIAVVATELRKMGANIEELPDGLRIRGKTPLRGATVASHHDHRIAMSLYVAGLVADGASIIEGFDAIHISYPEFLDDLHALAK